MAGSLNKVLLIGRLGKDPELREFPSGGKVCNFSLATSETWKDSNTGERQERTSWHNIAIFNERLAEIAEQYLRKGSQVYIEGQLETRKWQDQAGNDRYTTEIHCTDFTFLSNKSENEQSNDIKTEVVNNTQNTSETKDDLPF